MTVIEIKAASKQHLAAILVECDVAKWGEAERAGLVKAHGGKHINTLRMDVAYHYGFEDFRCGRNVQIGAKSCMHNGVS